MLLSSKWGMQECIKANSVLEIEEPDPSPPFFFFKRIKLREFSGSLMVRILHFHCYGQALVPGRGTGCLQTAWHSQKKIKKKNKT